MDIRRPVRRKLMGEINVVPFIDVMLVLLIVFMVTAPLITQGVKVELPKADSQTVDDNQELTLVVTIDAQEQYFISLGEVPEEDPPPVPLERIGEDVGKIMNQNPSVPVYLEADTSVTHGVVMQLVSVLERAGVPEVLFVTQPPGGE